MTDLSASMAYRAIYGAVVAVRNDHPEWNLPAALPRSVAKRATGTLASHDAASARSSVHFAAPGGLVCAANSTIHGLIVASTNGNAAETPTMIGP